jgi:transposase InsO family protein
VRRNRIYQNSALNVDIRSSNAGDYFNKAPNFFFHGSACRPWLTAVINDYSRSIAGYLESFEPPSSLRTPLALREAIWRKSDVHWQVCEVPDVLYVDNGADFVSKHLEQVAVEWRAVTCAFPHGS